MIKSLSTSEKKLIRSLVQNAERMIQAGISQTTRTCGTLSCACHADASRRHGPHTYLTFRSGKGKSSSLYVAPEHTQEAIEGKQAWDEFWETATALAAINRDQLKKRWQRTGKARAKR